MSTTTYVASLFAADESDEHGALDRWRDAVSLDVSHGGSEAAPVASEIVEALKGGRLSDDGRRAAVDVLLAVGDDAGLAYVAEASGAWEDERDAARGQRARALIKLRDHHAKTRTGECRAEGPGSGGTIL